MLVFYSRLHSCIGIRRAKKARFRLFGTRSWPWLFFPTIFTLLCLSGQCNPVVTLSANNHGYKEYDDPSGWWQSISYTNFISLQFTCQPPLPVNPGVVESRVADVSGTVHFVAHAYDNYFGQVTINDYDVTETYSLPGKDVYVDFLTANGNVSWIGTSLPYGADRNKPLIYGLKYNGDLMLLTNLVWMPDPFDIGLSDYFPGPATAKVAGLTGAVSGKISTTCSGLPVAGATIQIGSYSTIATTAGDYNLNNLEPGTYSVMISCDGYATYSGSINIPAGMSITSNFSLAPQNIITFYHEPALKYVGHVFVSLQSSTGTKRYYGFYPSFGLRGLGFVDNDAGATWDYAIAYPVTPSQYNAAARVITRDRISPPIYVLVGFNCVAWAAKVASAAGITLPPYRLPIGIPSDSTFGQSLVDLGVGATANCGTVIVNSGGAKFPKLPAITFPYDFSYAGLENEGHTNAAGLASDLGLQFDYVNLGPFTANVTNGLTITLTGVSATTSLISMNWGDGSPFMEQSTTLSHVFTNGTYTANILIIDNAAVRSYDINVSSSPANATLTNITVTPLPDAALANQGLLIADWVPNYPPPLAQSIFILPTGHALITFCGAKGESYEVQSASSLDRPFLSVTNLVMGPDGTFRYDDASATANKSSFYRMILP